MKFSMRPSNVLVNCEDLKRGDHIIYNRRTYYVLGFNYGWSAGINQVIYVYRVWFGIFYGNKMERIFIGSPDRTFFEVIN